MPSELTTERRGCTLVLTLSDPATRNTLSQQLLAAGIEALNVAESDPSLCAVIVRGDGAHFCAGAHLPAPSEQPPFGDPLQPLIDALRVVAKPVIAAVEGTAAGAGFSLALACDLIVAAEDARFTMTSDAFDMASSSSACWALAAVLPRQWVQQLVWLGEPLSARQLQGMGIVNRVSDSGRALDDALALADRLAALPPDALSRTKEQLNRATMQGVR